MTVRPPRRGRSYSHEVNRFTAFAYSLNCLFPAASQRELGITVFVFAGLESVEVILNSLCYNAVEKYQTYEIRCCHQRVEDVSHSPYLAQRQERSDKYREDIQPSVNLHRGPVPVEEIFAASFSVVVPAENRCECEE